MLDVAVIVLYRMICFVGHQRPFDRVENNVLGSPQSQVQLKPDFSHPWYFLQLNFCQGECEGVVMDIERATFNGERDRKSTRLNSSHPSISYAVFCLKKKKKL